ncbi:MAG: hypothetical protein M3P11_00325 [Actinomycetota bacterium]|nr:hypothetical protein [Actinomycetota bacterium]
MSAGSRAASSRQGWWGIAFAVLLLIGAGMVSVPTADDPAAKIVAFYQAHTSIVLVAEVVGILALVPLVLFIRALAQRSSDAAHSRRLMGVAVLVVVTELATNVPPVVLALASNPSPSSAHAWTFAVDLADATLFAALGLLALLAIRQQMGWFRWFGIGVAALCFAQAVGSPLGLTALDAIAPSAFLLFVAALSAWMLRTRPDKVAAPPQQAPAA